VEEETSDWEDFVLVTPKRTRKVNRKFLFSVSSKKTNDSGKENPCSKPGALHRGIPGGIQKDHNRKNKNKVKT